MGASTGAGGAAKAQRAAQVEELRGLIRGSAGMVFMDTLGLDSLETFELRKSLRPSGARLKIVKNRLMRKACEGEGADGCLGWLTQTTAVAFAQSDVVSTIKVLTTYAAEHEKVKFKGGMVEGRAVAPAELKTLAALPGRHELLTSVAVGLKAVLQRGARDFKGVYVKMVVAARAAAQNIPS